LHDETHVVQKSHIEHPVRFIKHHRIERIKAIDPALKKVFEAPRSADEKVVRTAQVGNLAVNGSASDRASGKNLHAAGEFAKLGIDLNGKFARRHDDNDALAPCMAHFVDERDEKRAGFSRTGIRNTKHVPAFKNRGNRFVLDGRRDFVALFGDCRLKLRIDSEIVKRMRRRFRRNELHQRFMDEFRRVDALSPLKWCAPSTGKSPAWAVVKGAWRSPFLKRS